jgi:hypothetical protein
MLCCICGNVGSGKTLLTTLLGAIANFQKISVISNYHLNFSYQPIEITKLIKCEYENAYILLDEAYTYLDSRLSSSNRNMAFSYVLFQSRKKNIQMFLTMQIFRTIDVRYRDMIDYIIFCQKMANSYKYTIEESITKKQISFEISFTNAILIYGMYDTNEVILSNVQSNEFQSLKFENNEIKQKKVNEICADIRKKYPEREKFPKSLLQRYFFENSIDNYLLNIVHSYLREEKEEKN